MCGITGWIDWRHNLNNEHGIIEKMAGTLSKRGPDDVQTWFFFSSRRRHTRLIVVDPAGGKQPMTKSDRTGSYTIVYNGELYNTEAIRSELKSKGYYFNSYSDTEVLLTAYMEWKENCVDILNGIFAFAIWDESEQRLFMARDRLGVKPLFFQEKDGRLLFGSELKAILAHPDAKPEIDRDGLAEIFAIGPSRTPGHGIFKGMEELRPAHALTYTRNGLKKWRYWNVESRPHTDSLTETVSNIKALVMDAIERQLVADVPVCTFLSGGVDSSAITAITARKFRREGQSPLNTYSVDYEENDKYFKKNKFQPDPDGPWIEKMSKAYGTAHHRCVISNRDLAGLLKEAVIARDQPGMADIDSSLLWFCSEIKEDMTVGLSGECADEIFGGYPWFHHPEEAEKGIFPWMRSTKARQQLLLPSWQSKLNLEEYVQRRYAETVSETPVLEGESEIDAKRRELFYMNMIWFMTTLLDRKDRMSMAASLEVRVPFADHRLVEYVWNVPWEMKMHGNCEKGILRKALEGILPDDVLYRKKSPYPKTHHPGYTRAVQEWMEETLNDSNAPLFEFLDWKKVKEINDSGGASFKDPWFGQLMTGPQLIAHLAQINYWFEAYGVEVVE